MQKLVIKIINKEIYLEELKKIAQNSFGDLVKAVVDIEKEIMAVGGELHADEEKLLLDKGSKQENLWGINIYPEIRDENWIEFDSIINLRPLQGNRSRGIDNLDIRHKIIAVIDKLIKR